MATTYAGPSKVSPQPIEVVGVPTVIPETPSTQETTLATTVTDIEVFNELQTVKLELQKLRTIMAMGLDTEINPDSDDLEEAQE